MVNNKILQGVYLFFASLTVTVMLYWRLFLTFYQQDEWQALGHFIAIGWQSLGNITFLDLFLAKGRLLTVIIYDLIFTVQPYGVTIISIFTLLLHALNGFLIFLLMQRFFKNKYISILTTFFFLTNSIANQAVIWPGASLAILGSTSFVLISLFYLLNFLQLGKIHNYIIALILVYLSLHLKESALAYIPLYAILPIIFIRKKLSMRYYLVALIPIIFFVLSFFLRVGSSLTSTQKVGDYVNSSHNVLAVLSGNAFTYTFTSFAQILVPPEYMFPFVSKFFSIQYASFLTNPQFDLLTQSIGADMINMFISLVFLTVLIFATIRTKHGITLILFIGMFVATLLPYIIIQRGSSYLESRYYYLLLVPMCGFLGIILTAFIQIKNKIYFIGISTLLLLLIISYVRLDQRELTKQQDLARQRNIILYTLKNEVPHLKQKTVFYIQSDQTYILPTNPLPFQEGIGYTFLVYLYKPQDQQLSSLLLDNFLWNTGEQGYRDVGDRGFGLFVDDQELKSAIKKGRIKKKDVISYYWDSKTMKLVETTKKTVNSL